MQRALFQKSPATEVELEAAKPLSIPVEDVQEMDERTWYERAYRGDAIPQLTVRATLMGSALGLLLSFTNVYIALKTGWHLGVNITACILSFTLWSTFLRVRLARTPMTILETNCMQSTASSAGYSTGSTLVTAIPAMLMLSVSAENPGGVQLGVPVLLAWVFLLALLGVCLAIPMKRNLINHDRLKFPSGLAAAATLQGFYSHGQEALQKGRALFWSGGLSMVIPLLKDLEIVRAVSAGGKAVYTGVIPPFTKAFDFLPKIQIGGRTFLASNFNLKFDNSVVLIGAGAIIGLRVTASMMLGALILAVVVTPMALEWHWTNGAGQLLTAASKPESAWKEIGLWIGAPFLVASGLLSFVFQWRTIVRAFRSFGGSKAKGGDELEATIARTEPPMSWFTVGVTAAGTGVVVLSALFFSIPFYYGVLAVLMTFVLALAACRVTGETDITPTGAMGKIMQLTYGVLIPQSTTANLMTAGITSGAAAASADLLNDLKSGYLLGANPRRQFIAQLLGIFTGTVGSVTGYFLLVPNAGALLGVDGADPKFPAPGAQQWKAVAELFKYGVANLHPMARYGIFVGVVAGVVLTLLEKALPKYRRFLPSPTGVGLGFILPFYNPLAMFLGAALAWGMERMNKTVADRYVVPVAAGVIAGESIMGVVVAAINNFVLH